MTPETVQGITLGVALLGAFLGVLNTVRDWMRDRERLKVIPKVAEVGAGDGSMVTTLAIEVVNLSQFPVTVDEVGFQQRGTRHRRAIVRPTTPDGVSLPRRLEPRSSATCYASPRSDNFDGLKLYRRGYAKTATGRTFTGTSPILKQVARTGELPEPSGKRIVGMQGAITRDR